MPFPPLRPKAKGAIPEREPGFAAVGAALAASSCPLPPRRPGPAPPLPPRCCARAPAPAGGAVSADAELRIREIAQLDGIGAFWLVGSLVLVWVVLGFFFFSAVVLFFFNLVSS